MDIREFLEARLAEEEHDAGLISSGGYQPQVWQLGAGTVGDGDADVELRIGDDRYVAVRAVDRVIGGGLVDDEDSGVVAFVRDGRNEHLHVVRHDPARILREVEAKRRILAMYDRENGFSDIAAPWHNCSDQHVGMLIEHVYAVLALAYDTHPSYDESWRP
jgi:hypothetical protein